MASRCTSYLTKCGSTSLCDQSCGVQPGDRQTDVTWTDKSLKTEGPKILSNYIFYFKTVIIGGPKRVLIKLSIIIDAPQPYL